MYQLILLIHVFAAVCIVALVLVQQGKGATVGAAFGSGASQTVFGSRGSGSFLFRFTLGLAAVFFVTSIILNYLVVRSYKQQANITLPFAPPKSAAPTNTTQPVPPPVNAVPVSNGNVPANEEKGATTKSLLPIDMPVTPADIPRKN